MASGERHHTRHTLSYISSIERRLFLRPRLARTLPPFMPCAYSSRLAGPAGCVHGAGRGRVEDAVHRAHIAYEDRGRHCAGERGRVNTAYHASRTRSFIRSPTTDPYIYISQFSTTPTTLTAPPTLLIRTLSSDCSQALSLPSSPFSGCSRRGSLEAPVLRGSREGGGGSG